MDGFYRRRSKTLRSWTTKKNLSDELLAGSGEAALTEMSDDDLLRLVALDLNAAMKD